MTAEGMKTCPYCAEDIKAAAIRCRYCQANLDEPTPATQQDTAWGGYTYGQNLEWSAHVQQEPAKALGLQDASPSAEISAEISAAEPTAGGINVDGRLQNLSALMGSVSLEFDFWTAHGAFLGKGLARVDDLRAWEVRPFNFWWGPEQLPYVSLIGGTQVTVTEQTLQDDPEHYARLAGYEARLPQATVPMSKWRGHKFKTKKEVLAAACQSCGHRYQLSGPELNALARQMGALHKFGRGLDAAWYISNISGSTSSRAGKQLQYSRAEEDMERSLSSRDETLVAVLCPDCFSDQVLFEEP